MGYSHHRPLSKRCPSPIEPGRPSRLRIPSTGSQVHTRPSSIPLFLPCPLSPHSTMWEAIGPHHCFSKIKRLTKPQSSHPISSLSFCREGLRLGASSLVRAKRQASGADTTTTYVGKKGKKLQREKKIQREKKFNQKPLVTHQLDLPTPIHDEYSSGDHPRNAEC